MTADLAVVVASHGRAQRLTALLDALAEQTLAPDRFEVVVAHTYGPGTLRHRLGERLTEVCIDLGRARPSVQRNLAWRASSAPLIAFTDDDCRPKPDWLERLYARWQPGSIVQGATWPDPEEADALAAAHVRTVFVDPPGRFTQTCNILYERGTLERLGGFDERAVTGEDIDLAVRARAEGCALTGAPDAVVYHAVDVLSLAEKVRSNVKWQHLAYVVRKHPHLRRSCAMGIWWKDEHLRAAAALLGLLGAPRRPWLILATLPFYSLERLRHGRSRRGQLRALAQMPSRWLVELLEIGTFIQGSLRYRTVLL